MNKQKQIPEIAEVPLIIPSTQQTEGTKGTETDEIAKLKAELQQAKEALQRQQQQQEKKLNIKIGEKGGVVVGGLGRFPITLYADQWEKLLTQENIENILKFISDNKEKLAVKK